MSIGEKSVIFLLGAGCSCDAGIPASGKMIENLEELLEKEGGEFLDLYYYVKHTIEYSNNILNNSLNFNIESLLVTLHSLALNKKVNTYQFMNGFKYDFIELAGKNFENITKLIELIEKRLANWVTPKNYVSAKYYSAFERFQRELTYAIRVFSLNYDLCLEESVTCQVETGFGDNLPWNGNRFIKSDQEDEANIYLYKLHGSINWERSNNQLEQSSQQGIKADIIFGTDVKLQAIDPYLFYLYEFRQYALSSELIIIIGYSFNDSHINDLIKQALDSDTQKKVLSISLSEDINLERRTIIKKLNLPDKDLSRIIAKNMSARQFLEEELNLNYVSSIIGDDNNPF